MNERAGAFPSEPCANAKERGATTSEVRANAKELGASTSEHGANTKEFGATASEQARIASEHCSTTSEHGSTTSEHSATASECLDLKIQSATGKSADISVSLTEPGSAEQIQVRVQLRKNNADIGEVSDPVYVTLNP